MGSVWNGESDYNQILGQGRCVYAVSLGGRVAKESKESADNWTKVATIAGVASVMIALLAYLGITLHHSPARPTHVISTIQNTPSPLTFPTLSTTSPPTSTSLSDQPSSQTAPSLSLSPSSGPAGTAVTATATNFTPGGLVQLYFQGELVGQADANEHGTAKISFSVPAQYAGVPGPLDLTVSASEQFVGNADQIFKLT